MDAPYTVAIIGSGPAGLSAAAHAAELGMRHILLEAQPHLSGTIHKYQKGKHVMAEPGYLDLRSPLHFEAGPREHVLQTFAAEAGPEPAHEQLVSLFARLGLASDDIQQVSDLLFCVRRPQHFRRRFFFASVITESRRMRQQR